VSCNGEGNDRQKQQTGQTRHRRTQHGTDGPNTTQTDPTRHRQTQHGTDGPNATQTDPTRPRRNQHDTDGPNTTQTDATRHKRTQHETNESPRLQDIEQSRRTKVKGLTCTFSAEGMMCHSYPLTRNHICGGVIHSLSSR
jgi:hypothetical protein